MTRTALTTLTAAALLSSALLSAQSGPYAKTAEIKIGGQGGHDYLAIDPGTRRLFVTNSTQVVVIDLDKNAVVGTIADTPRVHGVAFTPAGKAFTSNGGENKASIVDLKTLAVSGKVDIGPGPDAIMYEPKNNEIYAFNHTAGTATVVKADTGAMVATIKLSGGAVETGVADPALGRVFVNIEANSTIDAIDIATHQVVATWPIAPAVGGTGLAIDTTNHLLFSGGGGGKYTVMIDARTGKVVGQMEICADTDATAFDPATKYVFTSCSGSMTIGHEDSPTKLSVVQTLTTIAGGQTMAVDLKTHNLYVAGYDTQPGAAGRRPAPTPDTFRVLVFAMSGK
ncbi:MAG TPA: YncE family protein [Vicinamibacterales bacterium]|nr:YncE family protein [Vicinamibacterales bacterium]